MENKTIDIARLKANTGQIEGLPKNPRKWDDYQLGLLRKSLEETPELLEARGLLVYPHGEDYVVLGGNMRLEACRRAGMESVPCVVVPEDTPTGKLKEIVIKDNSSFGDWDSDLLSADWSDLNLADWGVDPGWNAGNDSDEPEDTEEEAIARKEQEFKERIAAGEISEEDEEYQEFLDKFKLKKTTDDCYTPDLVYSAVADWVAKEYGVSRSQFVRPFYPGGDYQKEKYKPTDIVVDNPPFSIMAEILRFYSERGIRYFLFAPHLTLFSSTAGLVTMLVVGVTVTYANGAKVNTSFVTNLEPADIQFRSAPTLFRTVRDADEANLALTRKELPKYAYDKHVVMSAMVAPFSRYGIDFVVRRPECRRVSELDAQKKAGKGMFGSGYLVSDAVVAEREKAEREKAEREKAEREKAEREKAEREKAEREKVCAWPLSERERAIIEELNAARKR